VVISVFSEISKPGVMPGFVVLGSVFSPIGCAGVGYKKNMGVPPNTAFAFRGRVLRFKSSPESLRSRAAGFTLRPLTRDYACGIRWYLEYLYLEELFFSINCGLLLMVSKEVVVLCH